MVKAKLAAAVNKTIISMSPFFMSAQRHPRNNPEKKRNIIIIYYRWVLYLHEYLHKQ